MAKDSRNGTEVRCFANSFLGSRNQNYANYIFVSGVVLQHCGLKMPTKQSSRYGILQYPFPEIVLLHVIPDLQHPLRRIPAPSLGRRSYIFLGHSEV